MYLVAFAPVNLLSSIILISKPCKSTGYNYIAKELFDIVKLNVIRYAT